MDGGSLEPGLKVTEGLRLTCRRRRRRGEEREERGEGEGGGEGGEKGGGREEDVYQEHRVRQWR